MLHVCGKLELREHFLDRLHEPVTLVAANAKDFDVEPCGALIRVGLSEKPAELTNKGVAVLIFCFAGDVAPFSQPVEHISPNLAIGPVGVHYNGEAKVVIQDIKAYEEVQETMALLKILALGNRQMEEGKVESADDVIQRLRARGANR
jgi:hypothetical protein